MSKSFLYSLFVLVALFGLGKNQSQAQKVIDVDIFDSGKVKAIPVYIEGFTGEVLSLLKFDLFVQGFEFVDKAKAQFIIKGSNSDGVSGAVYDQLKRGFILNKRYQGGNIRMQGHTFANNIVESITGSPGIGLSKIVFRQFHGRNTEIHVADFDGFNAKQVTRDKSISAGPDWAPDGGTLFYYSYLKNNPDIYSHNIRTGERRIVARYSGSNISPSVSPDGRRVAMVLSKSGSPDIWVANINGSGLRRLTTTKAAESSPCWSPDGRFICFVSRVSGRSGLYKIPANGGAMSRIKTIYASNATEPDWSPDGKAIAFTTQRGGSFDICIVEPSGGKAQVVASGEDPSWALNSRTLIFTNRSSGKRILSVLDVPTKRVKTLPRRFQGNCSQAAWSN